MNLKNLVKSIFDRRNVSIASDVGGHVAQIVADGNVTIEEVVEAAYEVVRDGLDEYEVGAKVIVVVPLSATEAAVKANQVAEVVRNEMQHKLADRELTADEANEMVYNVVKAVVSAINSPYRRSGKPSERE